MRDIKNNAVFYLDWLGQIITSAAILKGPMKKYILNYWPTRPLYWFIKNNAVFYILWAGLSSIAGWFR